MNIMPGTLFCGSASLFNDLEEKAREGMLKFIRQNDTLEPFQRDEQWAIEHTETPGLSVSNQLVYSDDLPRISRLLPGFAIKREDDEDWQYLNGKRFLPATN